MLTIFVFFSLFHSSHSSVYGWMAISPGILKNTTIDTQLRPLWYFPPEKKLNVKVFLQCMKFNHKNEVTHINSITGLKVAVWQYKNNPSFLKITKSTFRNRFFLFSTGFGNTSFPVQNPTIVLMEWKRNKSYWDYSLHWWPGKEKKS